MSDLDKSMIETQEWRTWNWKSDCEQTLFQRATGELPEMESTKQLAELAAAVYKPGMKVLDVGCATGHYLHGLIRAVDPKVTYHGIDATERYIQFAKQVHASNKNVSFEVGDIFDLPVKAPSFDIVYCCNVIIHLPDFRDPIRNLMQASKKYVFIRTLMSDRSYVVKRVLDNEFDENFGIERYIFQNIWSRTILKRFAESIGGFDVEFIADKFDPTVLAKEFQTVKKGEGTRVVDGMQVDGSILFPWGWMKLTRR